MPPSYYGAKESSSEPDESPSKLVGARVEELPDWQGETLSPVRGPIKETDPDVVEEVKWRKPSNPNGVPVWSHSGTICGESYREKPKLTFANGASLEDPVGLFDTSLDAKVSRAIDIHEGDEIDEEVFEALVSDAVTLNESATRNRTRHPAYDNLGRDRRPAVVSGDVDTPRVYAESELSEPKESHGPDRSPRLWR
ncbi:DUF1801 domain-containing protein [Halobium palmae]|uniref:DUF1801 domain-containing protein n=1 Tax=Halobium palmae TaxID=1776492 RepID=A0ABD5RZH3_9EURY